ncbi:MAG: MFS transporter [Candidatus Ranarchaeia archaeon]|jgi:MFS family permease
MTTLKANSTRSDPLVIIALLITFFSVVSQSLLTIPVAERLLYVGVPSNLLNTFQGWLAGVTNIPTIVLVPLFGWMMDRYGRRKVITPLILIFAVTAPSIYFIRTFEELIILEIVQAAARSSFYSLPVIMLGDKYKGAKLGHVMGLNATVFSVSRVIFPMLGGFLTEIDFRIGYLFFLSGIPLAILLYIGLEKYGAHFVRHREDKQKEKISLIRWFRIRPGLIGICIVGFTIPMVMTTIVGSFFQIYMQDQLGITPYLRGIAVSVLWAASIITASNLGRISRRLKPSRILALGFIIYVMGGVGIIFATSFETVAISMAVFGLGQGIVGPQFSALSADLAPKAQKALVVSLTTTLSSISRTIFPLIGGPVIDEIGYQIFTGFIITYLTIAIFGALLSPKVADRIRTEKEEVNETT